MSGNNIVLSNNKDHIKRIKFIVSNRLDELTDEDIFSLLDYLGWPEVPSTRFLNQKEAQRLSLWLLNRFLVQLKKRGSQQEHQSLDSDDIKFKNTEHVYCNIEHSNNFRTGELCMVSYLISHTQNLGRLSSHASTLSKLIFLDHKNLHKYTKNNCKDIVPFFHFLNGNYDQIKGALSSYEQHIESVQKLASSFITYAETHKKQCSKNKLISSFKINDIIDIVLSDVKLFTLWNSVYTECTNNGSEVILLKPVAAILFNILKHFILVANVMLELFESNTNIKSSYESVVDVLMEPMFIFRSRIDDMEMYTKMIYHELYYVDDMCHVISDVVDTIFNVVTFPITKRFICGCCDFVSAETFNPISLSHGSFPQVSGSLTPFSHKFMTKLVTLLNLAVDQEENVLVRGIFIVLPDLIEKLLISTKSYVSGESNMKDVLYYYASYFSIIVPIVINTSKKLFELPSNESTLSTSLIESVLSFTSTILVVKNFNMFVYNGERSNLITGVIEQSISFIFFCLEKGYYLHSLDRCMFNRHNDTRRYLFEVSNFGNGTCLMKFAHILWTSLDILVSLKLEYADRNIDKLLQLIRKDYEAYYSHEINIKTMEYFLGVNDVCNSNEEIIPSETFVENLITTYLISNDFVSLIEHIHRSVQINPLGEPFFHHPKVLKALKMGTRVASQHQIPLILNKFISVINDKRSFKFISTVLSGYLSGLEFNNVIIERVVKEFYELFKVVSFSYDYLGLTLALQFTSATRKLVSWANISEIPPSLHEILEYIYEYVVNFSKKKHGIMMWQGKFWICYHLLMVVKECGYRKWDSKVYKIVKRLIKSIVKSVDDIYFVKKAIILVLPNLGAFKGKSGFRKRVKSLFNFPLGAFDQNFSRQLCNIMSHLVDCDPSISKVLFKKVISAISCKDVDISSKQILFSTFEPIIEALTPKYGEMVLCKLSETCLTLFCGYEDDRSYLLITSVLKMMLSVLEYEEKMQSYLCFHNLTYDYLEIISGLKNVNEKSKKSRSNLFVLLSEIKILVDRTSFDGTQSKIILELIATFHYKLIRKIGNCSYMNSFHAKYSKYDIRMGIDNSHIESLILKTLGLKNAKELLTICLVGCPNNIHLNNIIILGEIAKNIKGDDAYKNLFETTNEQYHIILKKVLNNLLQNSDISMKPSEYLYSSAIIHHLMLHSHHTRNHMEYLDVVHSISEYLLENKRYGEITEPLLLIMYIILDNNTHLITSNFTKIYDTVLNLICAKNEPFRYFRAGKPKCSIDGNFYISKILKVLFSDASNINLYCKAIDTTRHFISAQAENDLHKNIGCFELLLLLVSNDFLKVFNDSDAAHLENVLEYISDLVISHLMDLCSNAFTTNMDISLLEAVVVNLQMNNVLSLKLYAETKKYVSEKTKKDIHTRVFEHLFETSEVAIKILSKCSDFEDPRLIAIIATLIYNCLYTPIKMCKFIFAHKKCCVAEGLSGVQIRRHTNTWIHIFHRINAVFTQFVTIVGKTTHLKFYSFIMRLMALICDKHIISTTKWYVPHILVTLIQRWYYLSKTIVQTPTPKHELIKCENMLRRCINRSIAMCEFKTKQNLFLLLNEELRAFIKDNLAKA